MSAYIEGMEIPKSYKDIRIYADGRIVSKSLHTYGEEIATAVPVPPHGRLIDADALCDGLVSNHHVVIHAKNAPTIIPAEEGET